MISTIPMDAEEGFCEGSVGTPNYDFYAGTSMSAPHVSGTAALLLATGYAQSGRELVTAVYDCLRSTARDPASAGGAPGTYDPVYGYGIVDAAAAVTTCGGDGTSGTNDAGTTDGDEEERRRDGDHRRDGDRGDDEDRRDGDRASDPDVQTAGLVER